MIVTLEISQQARRAIANRLRSAGRAQAVMADAVLAAATAGAEVISAALVMGKLGIAAENQHPATGLAASVMAWEIDRQAAVAAVGVPANAPAARYARILEQGGTIFPTSARNLAIPISAEARGYSSPRDMQGLEMIPRPGKPPLLVRQLTRRGALKGFELHWVLVPSVTIAPRNWLSRGAELAAGDMQAACRSVLSEYVKSWRGN